MWFRPFYVRVYRPRAWGRHRSCREYRRRYIPVPRRGRLWVVTTLSRLPGRLGAHMRRVFQINKRYFDQASPILMDLSIVQWKQAVVTKTTLDVKVEQIIEEWLSIANWFFFHCTSGNTQVIPSIFSGQPRYANWVMHCWPQSMYMYASLESSSINMWCWNAFLIKCSAIPISQLLYPLPVILVKPYSH